MSSLRGLVAEVRADALSAQAIPALTGGFTTGLGLLVAYGSLIFSGPLAAYTSRGVGLVLFGNFVACFVIALASGIRRAIAGISPALVVVLARIASSADAESDALLVTTVATLMISAVAAGVCFYLMGRYRLADLVRFIPYPVAGGFGAGIGAVVCLSAMSLMGADTEWRATPKLAEFSELVKWSPGAVFGIALYLAMKRWAIR